MEWSSPALQNYRSYLFPATATGMLIVRIMRANLTALFLVIHLVQ